MCSSTCSCQPTIDPTIDSPFPFVIRFSASCLKRVTAVVSALSSNRVGLEFWDSKNCRVGREFALTAVFLPADTDARHSLALGDFPASHVGETDVMRVNEGRYGQERSVSLCFNEFGAVQYPRAKPRVDPKILIVSGVKRIQCGAVRLARPVERVVSSALDQLPKRSLSNFVWKASPRIPLFSTPKRPAMTRWPC